MNSDLLTDYADVLLDSRPPRRVGPIWRRFFAYVIDGLILASIGIGIGTVFSEGLSRMGIRARIIGFLISLAYFGVLESAIGFGQSFGKRWMNLRVVDAQGSAISLPKSFLRSSIFLIPTFLYGLRVPETETPWVVSLFIFSIIFWIGGSTLYLISFNHQTRQGLHDLAVGGYVANADEVGPLQAELMQKAQWIFLGVLLVVVSAVAGILNAKLEEMSPFPELRQDTRLVEQLGGIQRAHLHDALVHSSTTGGAMKTLLVSITLDSKPASEQILADQIARIIFRNDQNAYKYDQVSIRIFYGYDIGIAQSWNHQEFVHSPAEWQQRLFSPRASGIR